MPTKNFSEEDAFRQIAEDDRKINEILKTLPADKLPDGIEILQEKQTEILDALQEISKQGN